MWIFKDDNNNVVTCFSDETYNRYAANVVGKASYENDKYVYIKFFLENITQAWKKGFIFTLSEAADPEDWLLVIKRFHPKWNIKPYKLVEVEWE